MPADTTDLTAGNLPKGAGKLRLLTRDDLDHRTRAARLFDGIETGIASDLGGAETMTTVETHLAAAFAGAAVHIHHINARLLAGAAIDLNEHALAISALVRVASRLPVGHRAKNVTPSIAQYLNSKNKTDAAEAPV
jgi:hypothetical protein